MAEKEPVAYQYDVTLSTGPFREPNTDALSYDFFVNRKGWLIPRVMRVLIDVKNELEPLQRAILGSTAGSPGIQLKLTRLMTRKIADQKISLVLEEGRIEKTSELLVEAFTGNDAYLFQKLEARMLAAKDRIREEIQTQFGL